jgi:MoxR-like ATPase
MSNRFFPVFISGHSGNGKTMSVEQACAKAKRKFVCVSMTPETDESDLLGNYVLIDGNMEWRDGPVTTAARQGAVLCIDEIDLWCSESFFSTTGA